MIADLDLLARLRDVHPPPAPSWWPLAAGWWAMLVVIVVLVVISIRIAPPWWRRLRLRRRLMAMLEAIARRHRAGAPAEATVAEVSSLLRRAALARFPESAVAGLHGGDWLAFLEARDRTPGRFAALRGALTVAPYAPYASLAPNDRHGAGIDAAPLLRAARGWLRAVL
jgi:hypothetical protein